MNFSSFKIILLIEITQLSSLLLTNAFTSNLFNCYSQYHRYELNAKKKTNKKSLNQKSVFIEEISGDVLSIQINREHGSDERSSFSYGVQEQNKSPNIEDTILKLIPDFGRYHEFQAFVSSLQWIFYNLPLKWNGLILLSWTVNFF